MELLILMSFVILETPLKILQKLNMLPKKEIPEQTQSDQIKLRIKNAA